MGIQIIESTGAQIPWRRLYEDPHTKQKFGVSARAHDPRALKTAIRADIGENAAYKQALLRGEIGIQCPNGANVSGADFITALREGATEIKEIVCTDVKTTEAGNFPAPKTILPGTWKDEVLKAVEHRLKLQVVITDVSGPLLHSFPIPHSPAELAALEDKIRQAFRQGRIRHQPRQLNADYSPTGQGRISGW